MGKRFMRPTPVLVFAPEFSVLRDRGWVKVGAFSAAEAIARFDDAIRVVPTGNKTQVLNPEYLAKQQAAQARKSGSQ